VRWWLDRLDRWQAHEADFMTLRQHAGITRQEVATLCAVTEATVRHWEAARKPPPRAMLLMKTRPAIRCRPKCSRGARKPHLSRTRQSSQVCLGGPPRDWLLITKHIQLQ
jgi:transcriptional regulator with XRE-family HTH domain